MRLPEIFKTMTLAFYQDAGLDGMTDADLIDLAVDQATFDPKKDELKSYLDELLASSPEVRAQAWWASSASVAFPKDEMLERVLREIRTRL